MKVITKRPDGSIKVTTIYKKESLTDTSYAKDCDVNEILKRYKKTGQIAHLAKNQGQYSDVSEIPDLVTAMDQVTKAQNAFDSLPAHLRQRFGNSPVQLVNFLKDVNNKEEAIKLGLIEKKTNSQIENQSGVNQAVGAVGTQTTTQIANTNIQTTTN